MTRGRALLAWWLLACATAAGFCALGAWQLGRMHEKQAMLAEVARVLAPATRHALPLSASMDRARAQGYDWAAGPGRFAPAPPVLLDNQQREGRAGVRAYRAFVPDDPRASPLLVELGWLPVPGDRRMPAVAPIEGPVRVEGLLMPPPAHGLMAAVATRLPDGAVLATSLDDVPALAALLGQRALAPRILRLDPEMRLGYVRDLDVLPNTLPPARHLGYAVQWFGLAIAVLATALVLTFRTPSRRP